TGDTGSTGSTGSTGGTGSTGSTGGSTDSTGGDAGTTPQPLMAAALPATSVDASAALTQTQLDTAVAQAKSEWQAVDPQADFTGFSATVGTLDSGWLGSENSGAVVIDATAAGWGWDVDGGQMSLITAVRHELGHVLGLGHTADTVMTPTLAAGQSYPVDAALLPAPAPAGSTATDASATDATSSTPTTSSTTTSSTGTSTTGTSTTGTSATGSTASDTGSSAADTTSAPSSGSSTSTTSPATTSSTTAGSTAGSTDTSSTTGTASTGTASTGSTTTTTSTGSAPTAPTAPTSTQAPAAPGAWVVHLATGTGTLAFHSDGTVTFASAAGTQKKTLAAITEIDVVGGHDDTLIVDRGTVDPAITVRFDGGAGYNTLAFAGVNTRMQSLPVDRHSGTMLLDRTTVVYADIAPMTNSGTATAAIFDLGSADDTCTLSDAPTAGQLRMACDGMETTDFNAPGTSLTIQGTGNDILHIQGTVDLAAAALNVAFRQILLDSGLTLTAGAVSLTASQTVTGGISSVVGCLGNGTLATHCADTAISFTNATVHAASLTASAASTVTPDSFYGIVVHDHAAVSITDGTIDVTGPVTIAATTTVPTFTANEKYTDNLVFDTAATVTVGGAARITGGAMTFTSTANVNGTANPGADAGKNQNGTGADGSAQKDAAVATVTVFSTATTALTGTASLGSTGDATLAAVNDVAVAATADASAASNGAGIAVVFVHQNTDAHIDSTSPTAITANDLAVTADSTAGAASTANTSAGGASANDKDANDPSRANGNSKTADGNVGLTAALAVVVLTGGTHAYIAPASGTLTVTTTGGTQKIHAGAANVDSANASGGNADGSGANGSVGVGVAVDVATFTTEAYLGTGATLNAQTVTVEAVPPASGGQSQYGATAVSGAAGSGGDSVSVAGSVAVNVVVLKTYAQVRGTDTVNGDLNLTGTSDVKDRTSATSKKDGTGNSVGVGASVSIDIVNDTTNAGVTDGATLAGVHALTLRAKGTSDSGTTATSGASGGSSLVLTAVVALNVDNIATSAGLGTGAALTGTGAVDAQADQTAKAATTATGATDGGNLAIGAAVALTLATHDVDSSTARTVTAGGNVAFRANGSSDTDTEATASAAGAKGEKSGSDPSGDTSNVNQKGDKQASFASSTSTANGGSASRTTTPSASTGDNGGSKITVAAAIAFNLIDSSSTARLADGQAITSTGGQVTLATTNTTHAKAIASGKATTGSSLTIGAGVAINLVNITNDASIGAGSTVTAATGVTLAATMNTVPDGKHTIDAEATSGASGSDGTLGLAGSFAMNLVNEKTTAQVHAIALGGPGGIAITGLGDLTMTATSSGSSHTSATSDQEGGATVGIGASVGLNLVDNDVFTGFDITGTPANGPPVTGARNITLTSSNADALTNETDAGGQGGKVTVTPSVAVSIANESSEAAFGAGPLVTVTGAISANATFTGSVTTTANGDTGVGSTAGIGISLALAIVNHTVDAHTARSLHAHGAIGFSASGWSQTTSEAQAAANGAKDDGQDTNKKADDNLKNANTTQAANNADGKDSGKTSTPKDGTADGKSQSGSSSLSVAAALAINIVTTVSQATVADGLTITSDTGTLTLSSTANTTSSAHGKGDSTAKASVGVGVGVGVNSVDITNHATVGASTVVATGLDLAAGMTDIADPDNHAVLRHWNGTGWDVIDRGKQLPGPSAGVYFVLTADDGSNHKGVYEYNSSGSWVAQSPTSTVPADGADFPASPATNAWFILDKAKDGHPQGSLYQYDGTQWVYRTSDSGAKLPTGGPKDKDYYELTAADGLGHAAGLYRFSSSGHAWNVVAGPFAHGTALPVSPTTDQIFRLDEHEVTAQAEAGVSGDPSSVGVAGAVSLNLVQNDTAAVVASGAHVTLTTGDLTLSSRSNERDVSDASAKAEVGDAVGVGAAVAMNFMFDSVHNQVRSEVQDGATVAGGADVTIDATGFRQVETETKAGTESGSNDPAITPAVALTISNHDHVVARLGTATGTLTATGAVKVEADHTSEYSAKGDADAASGNVAIGAVVAINVVLDWGSTAEVARSLHADSAEIHATSEVSTDAETKASAKGTQDNKNDSSKKTDSSADSKSNQQITGTPSASGATSGSTTPSSNSETQSANSSSSGKSGQKGGGTGIAAAIAVNWVSAANTADIADGVTITATGGEVDVTASDLTGSTTKATGIAADLNNNTSIGAAVSLDVQTMHNTAAIGDSTVTGDGITVQAITPTGKHDDFIVWAIAAAAAKEDAGVAGSAGIHVLDLETSATVAAGATLTSTGDLTVAATTDLRLLNLALTGALATSGAGVGGAFAVNILTHVNTIATIDSTLASPTTVQAAGALAVTANDTFAPLAPVTGIAKVDGYLPALSSVAVGGAAGGDGAAVSLTVVVDVFSFDTEATIGDGAQVNQTATGDSGQSVNVSATDHTTIVNVAGSVALSLGSASVGGSVVVDVVSKDVRARIGSQADVTAGGDVTVSATATEVMTEVAAGASASTGSAAIQGTVDVIILNPGTHAVAATIDTGATVHANGKVAVTASDTADKLSILSGNVAVSTGGTGIGASVAILIRNGTVTATIGTGAGVEGDAAAGVSVGATQEVNLLIMAVAGAGGETAGVGGSVVVDVLTDVTTASIGSSATIDCTGAGCTNSSAAPTQVVAVQAQDTTTVLALAGALAVGGTAGVGIGVDTEDLHKTTTASIGGSATVRANGDVVTKAISSEDVKSISVGLGGGGTAAVTVNAAVPVIDVRTDASIGGSANVRAGGNVVVSADEQLTLMVLAGNVSVGGTAAVGAGVAVPVVTKNTDATIGAGATVTALGAGTHITDGTVNAGSYVTAGTDPRFDPRGIAHDYPAGSAPPVLPTGQGLEGDGVTINLGYAHGFQLGQQVVYDAGGGAPITGLTDGGTYYVIPVSATEIRLYTMRGPPANPTCADPNLVCGLSLPAGARMGENQRFVPTDQPGVASDTSLRFSAPNDVSTSGDYVVLPYDWPSGHAPAAGDPVVYSAGGGTAIGGLVDGATYYVVDPSPLHFQIAATYCDAIGVDKGADGICQSSPKNGGGVSYGGDDGIGGAGFVHILNLTSTGTGRSQSFVPAGMLPAGNAADQGPQTVTSPTRSGFQGVAVTASNSDVISTIGVAAGGAGTAAVSLSGSVAVVTVHTTATIGNGAHIDCAAADAACATNDPSADPGQSVLVSAVDNFRTLGIAASIAVAGTAGVGASAAVRVVELHDDASIGDSAVVNARNNVEVRATASDTVVSVNAAAAGGTVGVAGTVGVSVIKEYTDAFTGTGTTIRANGSVGVIAGSTTQLLLITASIAAGYVGVGVGVDVAVVSKQTRAYLGANDVVVSLGQGAGLAGADSGSVGGSSFGTTTVPGLVVQADSSEKLFGLVAGVAAGAVGVTGNVGVTIFTVDTQAFVASGTTVNRKAGGGGIIAGVAAGQGVDVSGTDHFDSLTFAGGVAGGFVGVAGGVDIGVAKISVLGMLASGTDVWANGTVRVNALSIKHVQTYAVSVGGGFVGVAGAVSVWSVGTAPNATYSADDHGPNRGAWSSTANYASGDVVSYGGHTWIAKQNSTGLTPASGSYWKQDQPQDATQGQGTDAKGQADSIAAGGGSGQGAPAFSSAASYSKGDYVTYRGHTYQATADISAGGPNPDAVDGSGHVAAGNLWYGVSDGWKGALSGAPQDPSTPFVTAHAYHQGDLVSYNGHHYEALADFTSGSTPDVDTADWQLADDNYQLQVAQAGQNGSTSLDGSYSDSTPTQDQFGATVAAPVACDPSHAPEGTASAVCGSVHSLGGDVQVKAIEHLDVFALAGAVAGGAGALGAGITVMSIGDAVDAGIYNGASVSAAGTVGVHAEDDENVTDIGVAGALGGIAIGAQVVVLTDSSSQKAHIDDGAVIPTAGTLLRVDATANRTLAAYAIGITLAAAGAGAAVSVIELSGDTQALIGTVAIGSGGAIGGIDVEATDDVTPTILAVGVVAGAGLALSGIVTVVDDSGTTRAASFAHGTVTIGSAGVTVSATGTRSALAPTAVNIAVGGGLSVGFTLVVATQERSTEAELGGSVTTSGAVDVESTATDVASAFTPGAVIGAAAIAAMIPIATVSGHTTATLSGTVGGASAVTVHAAGVKKADAEVDILSISGIGLSVGVAVATVSDGADIQAQVTSTGSVTTAGQLNVTAETTSGDRNEAVAIGRSLSGALLGSGAIFAALASLGGAVRAELDGSVTSSAGVAVSATGTDRADSELLVVDAGGLGGVAVSIADAQIRSAAEVEALAVYAGSARTITSSGAVTFGATSHNTAITHTQMGAGGGLFGVGVSVPTADVAGATTASVDSSVHAASLSVTANGTNSATTTTDMLSIGGLAGVGADSSTATIESSAVVTAAVGSHSTVTLTGAAMVSVTKGNTVQATTGSVNASLGASVGAIGSDAEDHGGSSASFGGELVSASQLTVKTDATDAATTALFVVSVALGVGASVVSATGNIDGADAAFLAGTTNIHSAGTAITVHADRGALALTNVTGGAGGILGSGTDMKAIGTVGGSVSASVAAGATVGTLSGRPASLAVTADDAAVAGGGAKAGAGSIGLTIGSAIGSATANPTVQAYLGGGVHVVLGTAATNGLTVTAISHRAQAVGTAKVVGGGIANVGLPAADATSQPTVDAHFGPGTTIIAGGTVILDAESLADPQGAALTDDIVGLNVDGGAAPDDTVLFPQHGLSTGDQVLYQSSAPIGGLRNGHTYSVVIPTAVDGTPDPDHVAFGVTWAAASIDALSLTPTASGVDTARGLLRFSGPHHFENGDALIYRYDAAHGSSIGLTNGGVYYVRVIDPYTVALYTTQADALQAAAVFQTSAVSGNLISGTSFTVGQKVTYRSAPASTFTHGPGIPAVGSHPACSYCNHAVDVNVDGSGHVTGDDSTAYNVYLPTVNVDPNTHAVTLSDHNLQSGEAVTYRISDAAQKIPELTVGATYYVIRIDAYTIRLAATYCDSVGHAGDASCPTGSTVTPIHISAPPESSAVQAFAPVGIGLADGATYTVASRDGSGRITLAGQTLTTAHVFGDQTLFLAGTALAAGSGAQQLIIRLTGT
ncbi:MAG TPA: hypothetical protein VJR25_09840, partial [Microbacterium sp.]|uniref:hypothetical protein n=1 Tax=Microbacterium sp. TaxID=51671 RepID=UPI002B480C15